MIWCKLIAMDYSFECNPIFSYIFLFFSHIYFVLFQLFLSRESFDSLIFFSLSKVLISDFLIYFLQYLKLSNKFFVSHCMFKQWLIHQVVTQIEVI